MGQLKSQVFMLIQQKVHYINNSKDKAHYVTSKYM